MELYLEDLYTDKDINTKLLDILNQLFPKNIKKFVMMSGYVQIEFKKSARIDTETLLNETGLLIINTNTRLKKTALTTSFCGILPVDYNEAAKFIVYLWNYFDDRTDSIIQTAINDLEF